ncbi:hypothetical protein NE237_006988 [Protea cynaroides]|uniref:Uncharacterized protein n=1 Tax=Protea cynaroides TaxID=273540 RepID=A0A9Q0QW17_9MAGN|nr:hypothetical protein NE237_006988 [Protea cynaroides]
MKNTSVCRGVKGAKQANQFIMTSRIVYHIMARLYNMLNYEKEKTLWLQWIAETAHEMDKERNEVVSQVTQAAQKKVTLNVEVNCLKQHWIRRRATAICEFVEKKVTGIDYSCSEALEKITLPSSYEEEDDEIYYSRETIVHGSGGDAV